jgi:glycosyltransferase involved in cell wall biosynthesis
MVIPLLSLIVPHYNQHILLSRLLKSILIQQNMNNLEVIFVDDCSDKQCIDIINTFSAKGLNLRLIETPTRKFTKNCRIIGIEAEQGDIIGFADADDMLWGTGALEYHARLLTDSHAGIVQFAVMQTNMSTQKTTLKIGKYTLPARLEGDAIFKAFINTNLRNTYF